jgi:hypothetical protein
VPSLVVIVLMSVLLRSVGSTPRLALRVDYLRIPHRVLAMVLAGRVRDGVPSATCLPLSGVPICRSPRCGSLVKPRRRPGWPQAVPRPGCSSGRTGSRRTLPSGRDLDQAEHLMDPEPARTTPFRHARRQPVPGAGSRPVGSDDRRLGRGDERLRWSGGGSLARSPRPWPGTREGWSCASASRAVAVSDARCRRFSSPCAVKTRSRRSETGIAHTAVA